MKFNQMLAHAYRLAITLIVGGFLMLCQPLFQGLFAWGFPVLLVGVLLFMILDHVPEKPMTEEDV